MPSTWAITCSAFPGVWSEKDYAQFYPSKRVKSEPKEFGAWMENQSEGVKRIFKPCPCNPRYAKMARIVKINQEAGDPPIQYKQQNVICIDPKSEFAGNIYSRDSKSLLYLKFFASTLARPFHMIVKTLYHATLMGVAKVIFDAIEKEQKPAEWGQKIVRSLADIVRTPLYELIMIIVSAVALIVAPFNPTLLYDFRSFTGKLSNELFWGGAKKVDMPANLTPCMSRLVNVMDFEKNQQTIWTDKDGKDLVQYRDKTNLTLVGLDNIALRGY